MKPPVQVRMLVTNWDEASPRGAVALFCLEHNVSRSWFYKVRSAAAAQGKWAALDLGSTKPKGHPAAITATMIVVVLEVREKLKGAGLDYGPLSVAARMRRTGLVPPSRASLARIFSRAGVVKAEPRKRPRSAFRRFVYPAPNCLWQIDATDWTLSTGQVVVIFQLIDDHSRLALASLVATGETGEAARRVVDTAISRYGTPQKFLSDNGSAFNTMRRGYKNLLVTYLESLGVEPITGKPGKPTTQGKNERFHRTLHRFLNANDPASTIDELQALVDRHDQYYNDEREHQALPNLTPREAWDATAPAPSPIPPQPARTTSTPTGEDTAEGHTAELVITARGIAYFQSKAYGIGQQHAGKSVHLIHTTTTVTFYDTDGTEIISHVRPPAGQRYAPSGLPVGHPTGTKVSTKH